MIKKWLHIAYIHICMLARYDRTPLSVEWKGEQGDFNDLFHSRLVIKAGKTLL